MDSLLKYTITPYKALARLLVFDNWDCFVFTIKGPIQSRLNELKIWQRDRQHVKLYKHYLSIYIRF